MIELFGEKMKIKCFVSPFSTTEHIMYYIESNIANEKLKEDEK